MILLTCGLLLGATGPGKWSIDEALDIRDDLTASTGLLIAAAGGGGALLLPAACWRPAGSS